MQCAWGGVRVYARDSHTMTTSPTPTNEWAFVKELSKQPKRRLGIETNRIPNIDEVDLRWGFMLEPAFPDPDQLLVSATSDLRQFLAKHDLWCTQGVMIETAHGADFEHEAYHLDVGKQQIRIIAGDTEGIRRGIYHLLCILQGAEGPSVAVGARVSKPWVRNRISRCYFGPIKRPPFNRDELLDEGDYYPDGYLSRLAEHGTNGVWLTIELRDLCATAYTSPPDDAGRRLEALRRTVSKCRRYGIKVWAFCIEPAGFEVDDPVLREHPEFAGADRNGTRCFCPSTDAARRYLYEATHYLFSQVPQLAGLINISHGEGATTCLSAVSPLDDSPVSCPRCREMPKWKVLHQSLDVMAKGMTAAAPEAKMICWLYMPQTGQRAEWVFDLAARMPEGVILQYNFESNAVVYQLEQPRVAGDYWLSTIGPSNDFKRLAERARQSHTPISAKLQVGTSHEVATVPAVPAPTLLHQKYRAMQNLGCSHVMQCWYFGSYPSVMNRAAGMLACHGVDDDEDKNLRQLARVEWGEYADTIVSAWKVLASAYSHYPFDNMFQYYGPMHDGPTWALHLKPVLEPLAPTWKVDYPASGDVIGECLGRFTLAEALAQCDRMADTWSSGAKVFGDLREIFSDNQERLRDIGLVEALGILFDSGRNILRFYLLRKQLYMGQPVLGWLRKIVEREISNSERLAMLCESDPTLGFHSEAESYKFDAESLRRRIMQLDQLLNTEFVRMQEAIENGYPLRTPST